MCIRDSAYRDRHGQVHLPLDAAVALAQAFAEAEPQTVVGYLDDQEQEMRIKGNQPGDRWYHQYLRELSPGFALARQWAGLEQEAEMLRKEIARLRTLVSTAAHDLKAAGHERKGQSLTARARRSLVRPRADSEGAARRDTGLQPCHLSARRA